MDQTRLPVIFGKRVFVADDNETNLTLMTELLAQDRHEVAIARCGTQSLEILSVRDFDVMFLDVGMKDMDGAKLLQVYRFGKLNAPPAFFLTTGATAETPAKLQDTGAVGVLHKPVTSKKELRHAIALVCQPGPAIALTPFPTQVQTPAQPKPPTLKVVSPQFIDRLVIEKLKSVSANPEFLRELLLVAAEDIGRISDDLVQTLASGDFEGIRDTAHALKGVAASVGASRLVALASKLMRATREQPRTAMSRVCENLAEVSQASVTALLDIVAGPGSHPSPGPRAASGVGRTRQEKQQNG